MDDFGEFCYLDVQKTGSTFITKLLIECSHSPLLHSGKHSPIIDWSVARALKLIRNGNMRGLIKRASFYREGTFYFNSVRNPYAYYASLYNYGCDGRGAFYNTLKREGLDYLYDGTEDGFFRWIEFIMDASNARHLDKNYERSCATAVGFLTYRFLRLSVSNPYATLSTIDTPGDAFKVYAAKNICTFTIKNEQMKSDVLSLIKIHLSAYVDRDKAAKILDSPKVNVSKSGVANALMLENSEVGPIVRERDALIFDTFYTT